MILFKKNNILLQKIQLYNRYVIYKREKGNTTRLYIECSIYSINVNSTTYKLAYDLQVK